LRHLDKIYNYIFLLLCFVIPFSGLAKAFPNILIIALVVLFPFHSQKKKLSNYKKEIGLLLIFCLLITINTLIFERFEDLKIVSRLFYIPLVIALSSVVSSTTTVLKYFVGGSLFILIISSIKVLRSGGFELANGDEVNQLLMGERPYLGFVYVISALFCFYLGMKSKTRLLKTLYWITSAVFVGFIFLIAARLSTLSVFVGLILAFFYFISNKKVKLLALISIPFFLVLLLSFSDNLSKRFYINEEYANFLTSEPRYYIWDCAYQIAPNCAQDFIFGYGYYTTEAKLGTCYTEKDNFIDSQHKQWFLDCNFNTHNQFLDIFLSQGLLALIVFIVSILYLLIRSRSNFYALSLALFIVLFFSFENVLTRQIGCMLISILIITITRFNILNRNKLLNHT